MSSRKKRAEEEDVGESERAREERKREGRREGRGGEKDTNKKKIKIKRGNKSMTWLLITKY